jgi:hypothetical protein
MAMTLKGYLVRRLTIAPLLACTLAAAGILGTARAPIAHARAQAGNLVVVADAVLGGGPTVPPDQSCTIRSRFPQGSAIVFRVKVIDGATGAALDNTQFASVTITLPDGSTQNFAYAPHPPGPQGGLDSYWTYAYTVAADYPTGAFNYSITVTDLLGNSVSPVGFNIGIPNIVIVPAGQS